MTLTLLTQDFTLLLSATKMTAYPKPDEDGILSGLCLYTTEGEDGDNVGVSTLLVGIGYDGSTVGQFAVPVSGTLAAPILLPYRDTGWLSQMCDKAKLVAGKTDKEAEHTVELTVNGSSLTVKTLTDGFPADYDVYGNCPILDTSQYPAKEAKTRLFTQGLGEGVTPEPDAMVWLFGTGALKVMQTATKILKSPVRVFPSAINGGPAVLTDGVRWRGVTSVEPYEGGTGCVPDIEPLDVPEPAPAPKEEDSTSVPTPTDDAEVTVDTDESDE